MADQINALLGDVDAPGRWHYRSLSLLTTRDATKGGAATGLQLAHQYLDHFRCQSDYKELLSRTALPVGVRKGMVAAMGNRQAGVVVLGPNTCTDLPSDASFEFVQILDDTMRRDALIPSQSNAPLAALVRR